MEHRNTVEFKVYGDYALFSDPVTRVGGEKGSLTIPTYEAIKGVMHSIYYKPTLIWIIDKVRVIKSIQTQVKGTLTKRYNSDNVSDLSFYTYLKDVEYQVQAHFIWNDNRPELERDRNEHKHYNIAKRMINKGGRRDIFLGTRECQAYVEPCDFGYGGGDYDDIPELSFGFMYHGITYADEAYSDDTQGKMTARFWYPVMRNGVIEYTSPQDCPKTREIRKMKMKVFGEEHKNFKMEPKFDSEVV